MNVEQFADDSVARIAAAIGDPARARILYCLMDCRARTSTELAVVAGVGASTASIHLNRLKRERLVTVLAQGKHRYYSLKGPEVAKVLEGLSALAGASRPTFIPNTPHRLRAARTCYDHIAGSLGVHLHDRFVALGWLSPNAEEGGNAYNVTEKGAKGLGSLGIKLDLNRASRRRFAFGCLDWSERRCHLGGSLGASVLNLALKRKWIVQDLDSRALQITSFGRTEMRLYFGLSLPESAPAARRTTA